jgi:hypothetical protein
MSERISRAANWHRPISKSLCHATFCHDFPKRGPDCTGCNERYLLTLLISIIVLAFSFFPAGAAAHTAGVA